jgi:hypothetical protein
MSISSLVPSWLHREQEVETENYVPIATATLPDPKVPPPFYVGGPVGERPPEYSQADHDREIFGKAAVMLEQIKRDRDEAQAREDDLKGQLAEAVLARASDSKKIGFLELENIELRNNIAALQSDIEKFREFMSKIKAVLDMFGIKAPEKKRKAKAKKADASVAPEQPVIED